MFTHIMFILTIVTCSTTCNQTSEHLLKRAQKLCDLCQAIPTTSEAQSNICDTFKDFCSNLYKLPSKQQESTLPVIESDNLLSELEGDDLPEFPSVEEIGIYRPEDGIISPHERFEQRRLSMLIKVHDRPATRMFSSSTAPKEARELFGRATTQLLAVNGSYKKMRKIDKRKHDIASLSTVEKLYIDTASTFLDAHDAGSPYALKEAIATILGAPMQDIITLKTEMHEYSPTDKLTNLCQELTQRAYYQTHANVEELYCYSQLALADIYIKYYRQQHHAYSIESIMYEQAYYVIVRKLLQAHDMGHPEALKDAEDLMSRAEILSIIEQKKKQKIASADTQFAATWRDITMRKYHTQPILDAQLSASSSNLQIATDLPIPTAPLEPCSSTDTCNSNSLSDIPPIDEPKD